MHIIRPTLNSPHLCCLTLVPPHAVRVNTIVATPESSMPDGRPSYQSRTGGAHTISHLPHPCSTPLMLPHTCATPYLRLYIACARRLPILQVPHWGAHTLGIIHMLCCSWSHLRLLVRPLVLLGWRQRQQPASRTGAWTESTTPRERAVPADMCL